MTAPIPATGRRGRALGLLLSAVLAQGCTTYRIVRWRDPAPNVQHRIFPERTVHAADAPFHFTRAALRTDLDTVRVRDVDGVLRPFDEYFARRSIRAFVVVRNDTLLYERYDAGYGPATRSSSFSVAKSVTSALLGLALERGQVRSINDSITRYLPELEGNANYHGITVRQLLGMQSGLAYTQAEGSLWQQLRSSDAHFYYTNDRPRSLRGMRRADSPGARWAYKDSDTELLGLILARATRQTIAVQLQESIWRRIGTEHDASYSLDRPDGVENVSGGLNATALDYARFGRLYLHYGAWNGQQVLPRRWVEQSTTLDTTRTEPEVTTWYRMQHQQQWWLPMHNWAGERDFFADGSRGQRIYVHRPTGTIIVQVADDSDQEFPFRRIAHYLKGEPYRYPVGIAGAVLRAGRTFGADSARSVFQRLTRAMNEPPAEYTVNEAGLLSVTATLAAEQRDEAADALLDLVRERYPGSCAVHRMLLARRPATVWVPPPRCAPAPP